MKTSISNKRNAIFKGWKSFKAWAFERAIEKFFYSYTENDDKQNTFVTTTTVKPLFRRTKNEQIKQMDLHYTSCVKYLIVCMDYIKWVCAT